MHIRVKFLREQGIGNQVNLYQEQCVIDGQQILMADTFYEARRVLLTGGFIVPNRFHDGEPVTDYDQDEWVGPGAILAIALCNEQGYTARDQARIAQENEGG